MAEKCINQKTASDNISRLGVEVFKVEQGRYVNNNKWVQMKAGVNINMLLAGYLLEMGEGVSNWKWMARWNTHLLGDSDNLMTTCLLNGRRHGGGRLKTV